MAEMVNHPDHYNHGKVECIDAIEAALTGLDGFDGFCVGCALRYLWRWRWKGTPRSDLEKARWYIDRLLQTFPEKEV